MVNNCSHSNLTWLSLQRRFSRLRTARSSSVGHGPGRLWQLHRGSIHSSPGLFGAHPSILSLVFPQAFFLASRRSKLCLPAFLFPFPWHVKAIHSSTPQFQRNRRLIQPHPHIITSDELVPPENCNILYHAHRKRILSSFFGLNPRTTNKNV